MKQFGVWMDGEHATVVGRPEDGDDTFMVVGNASHEHVPSNTSEYAENNHAIKLERAYFKEIAEYMPNVEEVHVSGTGNVQAEFIHFLAETPQFKDAKATESTSNKMKDDELLVFIGKHFG